MKTDRTDDIDQSLGEVRANNKRHIRRFCLVGGAIVMAGLIIRLTTGAITYYSQRPPKIRPAATTIPGYYTEEEVMTFITNGISMIALVEKYGQPNYSSPSTNGVIRHVWFAPDAPNDRAYDFAFNGFSVIETNGIIVWKGAAHMTTH